VLRVGGIQFHMRKGMGTPKRVYPPRSVRVGGLRIGCSKIHKSELDKEIKLKRSSRAECEWTMKDWHAAGLSVKCEWTMKDWRAAMDQIKNRGCWVLGHQVPPQRPLIKVRWHTECWPLVAWLHV
jgi:hypothetical protein